MKRLRRASVIAALSLLAWALTASAECAWVLWRSEASSLIQLDAFDARPACVRLLDRYQRDGGQTYTHRMSQTQLVVTVPNVAVIEYTCLPDTLDPRGPKVK